MAAIDCRVTLCDDEVALYDPARGAASPYASYPMEFP
jgi:hypothetical protein